MKVLRKYPKQKKLLKVTECNPMITIENNGEFLIGRKSVLLKLKREVNRKYDASIAESFDISRLSLSFLHNQLK